MMGACITLGTVICTLQVVPAPLNCTETKLYIQCIKVLAKWLCLCNKAQPPDGYEDFAGFP